jgi:hypothetical protein
MRSCYQRRRVPAKVCTCALDARAPTGQQQLVDLDTAGLKLRPGGGEKKIRTRQTPRGVERESGLGVQSSASGA